MLTRDQEARLKARELGGGLIDHAIELALDGWTPSITLDSHEAALEILKRGVPKLLDELKKSGLF